MSNGRGRRLFCRCSARGVFTALVLRSVPAPCQDQSIAEALFREGRDAMKSGDVARACAALGESQRLDPSVGTVLNLAICEEQLGHLATAWSKYREVEDTVPPSDPRSALARHGREVLDPKVPRLRLKADPTRPSLELKFDGTELHTPAVGTWMPVDPGVHRLVVVHPDGHETGVDLRLGIGERLELALSDVFDDRTAVEKPEPEAPAAPAAAVNPAPHEPDRPRERSSSLAPIYVAGGLAAVGFVSAGVLGAVGLAQKQTVDAHCESHLCDRTGLEAASNGSRLLRVADVGLVVGVAGACVAGVLLWQREHQKIHVGATSRGAAFMYSADLR